MAYVTFMSTLTRQGFNGGCTPSLDGTMGHGVSNFKHGHNQQIDGGYSFHGPEQV